MWKPITALRSELFLLDSTKRNKKKKIKSGIHAKSVKY